MKRRNFRTFVEKASGFHSELRKHTTTAIITAFGLVIALSWQTVIKTYFSDVSRLKVLENYPYLADLYTAVLVTIFGVLGILIVSRWAENKETS